MKRGATYAEFSRIGMPAATVGSESKFAKPAVGNKVWPAAHQQPAGWFVLQTRNFRRSNRKRNAARNYPHEKKHFTVYFSQT